MENTVKLPCQCKNTFQDDRYGLGIRLHNATIRAGTLKKENDNQFTSARCTVCSDVKKLS